MRGVGRDGGAATGRRTIPGSVTASGFLGRSVPTLLRRCKHSSDETSPIYTVSGKSILQYSMQAIVCCAIAY